MADYSPPKDGGYKVKPVYSPISQASLKVIDYGSVNFGYEIIQEIHKPKLKSKCPRGAIMGDIGSCCGNGCTRACAIPD